MNRTNRWLAWGVPWLSEYLKNIFASSDLKEDSVLWNYRNTATNGKHHLTDFYILDAIISVGYRINSVRATPPPN